MLAISWDEGLNTLFIVVVNPISSVAHLKLHTKPEIDNFTISKIMLTIVFDQIGIELTKLQVGLQLVITYN